MSQNINFNNIGHIRAPKGRVADRAAELSRAIKEAQRTGDLGYAVELRAELDSLAADDRVGELEPEPQYPVHRFVDILRKSRIKSRLDGNHIVLDNPTHMHLIVSALVLGRLIPITTAVGAIDGKRVQALTFVNYPALAHLDSNYMVTHIELLSL